MGVIVQLGGPTPLALAQGLQEAGVAILGTSPEASGEGTSQRGRKRRNRATRPSAISDHVRTLPVASADNLMYPGERDVDEIGRQVV